MLSLGRVKLLGTWFSWTGWMASIIKTSLVED